MSGRGKSIKTKNRLVPKGLGKWRNSEVIIKANEDFLFGDANLRKICEIARSLARFFASVMKKRFSVFFSTGSIRSVQGKAGHAFRQQDG